ncbi:MAG: tRNA1(Val) (adenine(37)-N6)-methyltransferase [Merdibacter sp.]
MKTQRYTYDYIAGTDIHLWQRSDMFRINTDTAQLAHFMKVRAGERVLIGTNNGALLLCAEHTFVSVWRDIQANACQLAERNLKEMAFPCTDPGDFCEICRGDVVVCNPPFFPMGHHGEVAATPRSIARHELFLPLDRLLSGAARALKENGRLYMVHRSERLADIVMECRNNRLEIKTLQLVYDLRKELAVSVLIEAVLGAAPHCRLPHPILLRPDGTFTQYEPDR